MTSPLHVLSVRRREEDWLGGHEVLPTNLRGEKTFRLMLLQLHKVLKLIHLPPQPVVQPTLANGDQDTHEGFLGGVESTITNNTIDDGTRQNRVLLGLEVIFYTFKNKHVYCHINLNLIGWWRTNLPLSHVNHVRKPNFDKQ